MKKFLVLLLLSVFLYNQVGYFISFKVRQYEVRKEIKRRIKNSVPQGELTVIRIYEHNRHELQWVKAGKEFMFGNGLFDVVKVETDGTELVYHCINDTQEKQLFVNLDEHVRNHMDANGIGHKQSQKNVVKDYFADSLPSQLSADFSIICFPLLTETPVTGFGECSTPPPERA